MSGDQRCSHCGGPGPLQAIVILGLDAPKIYLCAGCDRTRESAEADRLDEIGGRGLDADYPDGVDEWSAH